MKLDNICKEDIKLKNKKKDLLNKIDFENEEFMILFLKNYYNKHKNDNLINNGLMKELEDLFL